MKDSQLSGGQMCMVDKYIKANNERFSTKKPAYPPQVISISRRIMKDSQHI